MRMYPREFPSGRRSNPKRQCGKAKFTKPWPAATAEGFVYYEWRRDRYGDIELDFALWVEGLGRIALQVKGGRYRLMSTASGSLRTRNGIGGQSSHVPAGRGLAGQALDLHDDIQEKLTGCGYNPFVIPVVCVHRTWGPIRCHRAVWRGARGFTWSWRTEDLVADLEAIVGSRGVVRPR